MTWLRAFFRANYLALDQLLNCWWPFQGKPGNPDELVSSRLGRYGRRHGGKYPWYLRWLWWCLNRLEKNHCEKSIEDVNGRHQPS